MHAAASLRGGAVAPLPFPHRVIDGYLPPEAHRAFRDRLDALLARGLSQHRDAGRLSKIGGYDCFHWVIPPDAPDALQHFYRRAFRDDVAQAFGLDFTPEVNAQINHHPVGSRNGTWHTDYVHCFHSEDPLSGEGMRPWYFGCEYQAGTPLAGGSTAPILKRVRTAAFLYYLDGDDWSEGDGGETGLGYESPFNDGIQIHTAVAPRPNRLLVFECCPHSFHRVLGNRRWPRSLVIGWLHGTPESAESRHGVTPTYWPAQAALGQYSYHEAT
ncbi:2OG-Fe(II) oxygenase [Acidovorax sp. NCPPB 4044]|uniref:2OG-Fe(II) oxygenase n=1 Tax=Acidovorax sp. NCPPB 4044 TaxID=2940490 RepID=UPI002304B626|nr:2OG-Fe(II) oxygenase [Acidovorax sp. NCPPB 4044]MDA8521562.1 2OG-Fe(II) oxygenase [Acidovorax sp. NCPPB 4044]